MKNCMGTHYQNIDRPSSLAAIACSAVFLIAGGCGSRRPVVDVPDAAARAIGEAGLIQFDPRGAPIDMPGDTPDMLSAPLAVRLALISDPAIQQALARTRANACWMAGSEISARRTASGAESISGVSPGMSIGAPRGSNRISPASPMARAAASGTSTTGRREPQPPAIRKTAEHAIAARDEGRSMF